jgi:succinoglycan biosynthesis transport protein ExoP
MELRHYFKVVTKWWWLILAATLVAAISSYYAVSRMPRVYQSTTTIRIGQALDVPNPTYEDFSISQQLARTYSDMVTRQTILAAAADALGLSFAPRPEDVSASLVPGTQLLEISVRDTDPERARALADGIARQLILQTPNEIEEDQARQIFVQTQLANLEVNIQATEEEIVAVQTKLAAADSARAIQEYENNIAALQQKLASYQATYASLLQSAERRTNFISVFEPALTDPRPVSPRAMETVLIAAGIGLLLAVSGAFVIEFLDDTIKTPDDIKQVMGIPTLGTVAKIPGTDRDDKLVTAQAPHSPIVEAYRTLRINLQVSSIDNAIRTLIVTSPNPIEGKSTTVVNLGLIVAQSGTSVILVDADLRRSSLHRFFNLPNKRGLTTALLDNEYTLDGALQETGIEGLRVLTSGPLPPDPTELLDSEKMRDLMQRLAQEAEMVIFDTPPSLPISDATILALVADGVLVVADAERTRRGAAQESVENLERAGARVLGAVLNRVSARQTGQYYYYGSYAGNHRGWRHKSQLALARIMDRGKKGTRPEPS